MRVNDFILAKREGGTHTRAELDAFIAGFLSGDIPDYQVAAWLMAVCWRGMAPEETADLTSAMAASGDRLDLDGLPNTVDKHSTGGVGDKTSLVLGPLLAACGATVAKMSGRGLGHTGGTIDKLESIPGFSPSVDEEAFLAQARDVGVVIAGQTKELAPADGYLYALRDSTATVESLPLIASSIMSKKLAGGASAIVLDVKVGSGAFMKTLEDARRLAELMMAIGRHAGREVRALLTDMEEPLGNAVGNALEVREAVACLRGGGPADLREVVLALGEEMLDAAGLVGGRAHLERALDDGAAYERFLDWIEAQGAARDAADAIEIAPSSEVIRSPRAGAVGRIEALSVGDAVKTLGGGRDRKSDAIDPGVGITLHAKVGDRVERGAPLATLHHRDGRGLPEAHRMVAAAIDVADAAEPRPLVYQRLRG